MTIDERPTVSEDVLKGSVSLCISDDVINNEIAEFLKKISNQKGFNPDAVFDPEKHILYRDEDFNKFRKLSLTDLGIKKTHVPAVSDFAVTDPFPLFTKEACDMMKWEAFQKKCLDKYGRLPKLAKGNTQLDFQICGYIKHAPFTYAAWTHPRVQEILDKIVGVDMKIMFDYEIAHINASLIDDKHPVGTKMKDESQMMNSVYDWHYDSNSFVIVLMLSTDDAMIGGKTGLKDGDENTIMIEDPKVGYASLLQGRVVKHVATKPITNHERISSVVGYIPKSVEIPDTTVLTSFRPSVLPRSIHDEYYPAWCEYRFKRIEEQLKCKREQLMLRSADNSQHFDQKDVIQFCESISDYIFKTYNEFELYSNHPYPPKIYSIPYSDL